MKKQLLVCALVITTINCYSQFSFGLKGGININNIEVVGLPSSLANFYKSNIGFHFGLYGRFNLTEKFSISPELQFSRRGAAINNPALYTARM